MSRLDRRESDDTRNILLPQRHAALLYRVEDSNVRAQLAREIEHLRFEDATKLVIDFVTTGENAKRPKPPRHQPDAVLTALDTILEEIERLTDVQVTEAVAHLDPATRRQVAGRMSRAASRLATLSASVECARNLL